MPVGKPTKPESDQPQATDAQQAHVVPRERRAMYHRPAIVLFVCVFLGALVFDLVVKTVAFNKVAGTPVNLERVDGQWVAGDADRGPIPRHPPIIAIPNLLAFQLTLNQGAVFGMGQGKQPIFVLISIIATVVIVRMFMLSDRSAWAMHLCLGLILSGALGNMYDRVRFSAVRDMLLLFPGVELPFGWSWGQGLTAVYPWIFNIADVALVVGVLLMMSLIIREWWQERRQQRVAESAPG